MTRVLIVIVFFLVFFAISNRLLTLNFVYVITVSTSKMELRRWTVVPVAVEEPRQVQAWSSKHYHKEGRVFFIGVTAILRCHRSRCLETVPLPVKGEKLVFFCFFFFFLSFFLEHIYIFRRTRKKICKGNRGSR